jgi:hypothetical protein
MNFYRGNFPVRPVNKNLSISYLRPFLASAMIAGGLVNLAAPLYAAGTTAAAGITNTATASYEDPNASGVILNTTSNTVTVTVAKIAGITISSAGITNATTAGSAIVAGNKVYYTFTITNTGNSPTKFAVPNQATIVGPGDLDTTQGVQWYSVADSAWYNVTDTAHPLPTVAADGSIQVRAVVVVRSTATSADTLSVQLGKTGTAPVAATATTPEIAVNNVLRANYGTLTTTETPNTEDIFTVDINAATDPAVNGTREAAAVQSTAIGAVALVAQAYTNININSAVVAASPNSTVAVPKNQITYNIGVNVLQTSPDPLKTASDLGATPIKLIDAVNGGTTQNNDTRVLISDPVPAGTTPTQLVAPTGWTAVYSTTPVVAANNTDPSLIVWTTTTGTVPAGATYVGFIKDGTGALPMSPNEYGGFKVIVDVAIPTSGTTNVTNIVDIYGTTPGNTTIVHDQSGTASPNTPTGGTLTTTPISAANAPSVLNGPKDNAGATGSSTDTTQNLDYTNKSAEITSTDAKMTVNGTLDTLVSTKTVTFNNTIRATGNIATDVYLLPTTSGATIPTGTKVAITYGSDTRTYTYTGSAYTADDATKTPIFIPAATAALNANIDYGVSVTLPTGTSQLTGYTAPITAFVYAAAPTAASMIGVVSVPTTGVSTNTTLDNVYTGFIKLEKAARVLNTASEASAPDSGIGSIPFSSGTLSTKVQPGQFIQYRIKYTNITPSATGTAGVVSLSASKLKVVEDGTLATTGWAASTTHSVNSATDSKGGVITYTGGTANDNSDTGVTKYVVDLPPAVTIAPGDAGNFTFLRKVK